MNTPLTIGERESELKNLKEIANKVLEQNLNYNKSAEGWKKQVVEKNIFNLKNIIIDIKCDLDRKNITKYINAINGSDIIGLTREYYFNQTSIAYNNFREVVSQSNSTGVLYNIASNTIFASIEADINWALHPSVKELTDISFQKCSPNILEKYVPSAAESLKSELKKFNSTSIDIKEINPVLEVAIKLSCTKEYSSSSILVITCLEAITLKILEYSLEQQNPHLSKSEIEYEIYSRHGSLNKLINKISLKEDFPVTYLDAATRYKHSTSEIILEMSKEYYNLVREEKYARRQLEIVHNELQKLLVINKETEVDLHTQLNEEIRKKMLQLMNRLEKRNLKDIKETRNVSIIVELEFLTRRIYEDRNIILHGQFSKIENNWKNYFYLVGAIRLLQLIKKYEPKTV